MPGRKQGYARISNRRGLTTRLGAGSGAENGLDQFLGHVGGGWSAFRDGEGGLLELNSLLIAVQISDAPRTLGQVLVELGPQLGGQVAEQVFVQKLGEFAAVHTLSRRSLQYRLRDVETISPGF